MGLSARCAITAKGGSLVPANEVLRQGEAALWLLCRYGGIGSKSRKGFGSFADVDITGIRSMDDCKEVGI